MVVAIPALPRAFIRCNRLDRVEAMAREAIALMLDNQPEQAGDIEVDVELRTRIADDLVLADLRQSERLAEDARRTAARAQRRAAEHLRVSGTSIRDIGHVLFTSHRRVS